MDDDDGGAPGGDARADRAPAPAALRGQGAATAAVAVGGAIGAVARYALAAVAPVAEGAFPATTFVINVVGCLLMGVLVVVVTEVRDVHPLARPFLGVGVLGGFTTFSTFAVEGDRLLTGGHLALAGAYLAGTVVAAVLATAAGMALTRHVAVRPAGGAR